MLTDNSFLLQLLLFLFWVLMFSVFSSGHFLLFVLTECSISPSLVSSTDVTSPSKAQPLPLMQFPTGKFSVLSVFLFSFATSLVQFVIEVKIKILDACHLY